MKLLQKKVREQGWFLVRHQVQHQVRDGVRYQIWDQSIGQVSDLVIELVRNQVCHEINETT